MKMSLSGILRSDPVISSVHKKDWWQVQKHKDTGRRESVHKVSSLMTSSRKKTSRTVSVFIPRLLSWSGLEVAIFSVTGIRPSVADHRLSQEMLHCFRTTCYLSELWAEFGQSHLKCFGDPQQTVFVPELRYDQRSTLFPSNCLILWLINRNLRLHSKAASLRFHTSTQ